MPIWRLFDLAFKFFGNSEKGCSLGETVYLFKEEQYVVVGLAEMLLAIAVSAAAYAATFATYSKVAHNELQLRRQPQPALHPHHRHFQPNAGPNNCPQKGPGIIIIKFVLFNKAF
jgi:hypothetical protein